jgi:hypothetical protein
VFKKSLSLKIKNGVTVLGSKENEPAIVIIGEEKTEEEKEESTEEDMVLDMRRENKNSRNDGDLLVS